MIGCKKEELASHGDNLNMLQERNVFLQYWVECIRTAAHVINCTATMVADANNCITNCLISEVTGNNLNLSNGSINEIEEPQSSPSHQVMEVTRVTKSSSNGSYTSK
ncbi:hypothetical protein AMTR_s00065p00189130 [Amborella trichopoda]|uniref:Uncharacterized protein n=1 Tax=Amborella trichopoda TaxID=13333 RepID=U5D8X4_AMBTC|nr:hypothetical protein AMTR_s00065p00189130 [Amborella trichopoda]